MLWLHFREMGGTVEVDVDCKDIQAFLERDKDERMYVVIVIVMYM